MERKRSVVKRLMERRRIGATVDAIARNAMVTVLKVVIVTESTETVPKVTIKALRWKTAERVTNVVATTMEVVETRVVDTQRSVNESNVRTRQARLKTNVFFCQLIHTPKSLCRIVRIFLPMGFWGFGVLGFWSLL